MLVVGLGASSLMLLFRGCGSSMTSDSAASDTAEAPADNGTAGAPETDGTASAETTEDSAAADDSASADSGDTEAGLPEDSLNEGVTDGSPDEELAIIGPLMAEADGVTGTRQVNITTRDEELLIEDIYHLVSAETVDTFLIYQMPSTENIKMPFSSISIEINGAPEHGQQPPLHSPDYIYEAVTLEAGREVTVTVTIHRPVETTGLAGFVLGTNSNVDLTEQTAVLDLESRLLSVVENTFGITEGTMALEAPEQYKVVMKPTE